MTEKLSEFAKNEGRRPWFRRWGIPAILLSCVAGILGLLAPEVKNWLLEGKLKAEIEHASGLVPGEEGPICEIGKFTIKFLNQSDSTIVVNELHFLIESDGVPVKPVSGEELSSWVPNGIHLPNLSPGQESRRSDHCDLTLKAGESGKIERTFFPPLIADARTRGVYRVRTIVVHSDGKMELPPGILNVGQTVFETNQLPTQYYRETKDGFEAIGPSTY